MNNLDTFAGFSCVPETDAVQVIVVKLLLWVMAFSIPFMIVKIIKNKTMPFWGQILLIPTVAFGIPLVGFWIWFMGIPWGCDMNPLHPFTVL